MINQERVRQLYKVALYEQKEEKQHEAAGQFYKSDFIGKEVVKSIFSGTMAYGLFMVIYVFSNLETVTEMLSSFEILNLAQKIGFWYVGFMAVYFLATILVYSFRYKESRKKLELYMRNLKRVDKMYERDEKLKI